MFCNTSIRVKVSADRDELCYTCTVTLKISLSGQSFTYSCTWGRVCVPWKPGSALRRKIKHLQAPLHTLSSTGVKGIMETEKEMSIEDIVHPSHHCEETLSTTDRKMPSPCLWPSILKFEFQSRRWLCLSFSVKSPELGDLCQIAKAQISYKSNPVWWAHKIICVKDALKVGLWSKWERTHRWGSRETSQVHVGSYAVRPVFRIKVFPSIKAAQLGLSVG